MKIGAHYIILAVLCSLALSSCIFMLWDGRLDSMVAWGYDKTSNKAKMTEGEKLANDMRVNIASLMSEQRTEFQNTLKDQLKSQEETFKQRLKTELEEQRSTIESDLDRAFDQRLDTHTEQESTNFKKLISEHDKYRKEKDERDRKKDISEKARGRISAKMQPIYNKMKKATEEHLLRHISLTKKEAQKSPKKIVIVSACDKKGREKNATMFAEIQANREEYAKRHGYKYQFVDTDQYKVEGDNAAWGKIPALTKAYRENPDADWIWWLDPDALIMNPDINVGDHILNPKVLEQRITWGRPVMDMDYFFIRYLHNQTAINSVEDDIDIVMTHDAMGWNAGSMFLKRNVFIGWLLDLWDDRLLRDQKFRQHEQSAFTKMAFNHDVIFDRIGTVPQRLFNAYWRENEKYRPGDFVVHFAGGVKRRSNFTAAWSKFVEYSKISHQLNQTAVPPPPSV